MRRRIAVTAALLGILSWTALAPRPGELGPSPGSNHPSTEQLWVAASHVVSATDLGLHHAAPSPTNAATPRRSSTVASVDSTDVSDSELASDVGGCRGCVRDIDRPRATKAPIPGTPKSTGGCSVRYSTRWNRRHQSKDGRWGVNPTEDCTCCVGPGHERGDEREDVERTALNVLAFTGNGHTHRYGAFKRSVNRAQRWLRKQQDPFGWIGPRLDFQTAARNHILATVALTELYLVTRDFTLRTTVDLALTVCQRDLLPRLSELSTSTRGWLLTAFKLSISGHRKIPGARAALRRVAASTSLAATGRRQLAVAALAASWTGTRQDDPRLKRAIARLTARTPTWKPGQVDLETWYFTTYAAFYAGGAVWKRWSKAIVKPLIRHQLLGGCADGSWDPIGRHGASKGRAWTYAMACLTLEIYYRYERATQND